MTAELVDPVPGPCTSSGKVPTTGLDEEQVQQQMTDLAVEFFNAKLARDRDGDGLPDATVNRRDTSNGDQADADGDGTGDACDDTARGTIPPTIVLRGPLTVDATGPAGAIVAYTATATDDIDPDPAVHCTRSSDSRIDPNRSGGASSRPWATPPFCLAATTLGLHAGEPYKL